jgi:hypothetical protein
MDNGSGYGILDVVRAKTLPLIPSSLKMHLLRGILPRKRAKLDLLLWDSLSKLQSSPSYLRSLVLASSGRISEMLFAEGAGRYKIGHRPIAAFFLLMPSLYA